MMEAIRNIQACAGIGIEFFQTIILKQNLEDIPAVCSMMRKDFKGVVPFLDILLVRSPFETEDNEEFFKICPSITDIRKILLNTPPGPYGLRAVPPCASPPHMAWPGGASLDPTLPPMDADPPWPRLKRFRTAEIKTPAPGYRLGKKCMKCIMKTECPGLHESYLQVYGEKGLNPETACVS
jgi:hypothetical protein